MKTLSGTELCPLNGNRGHTADEEMGGGGGGGGEGRHLLLRVSLCQTVELSRSLFSCKDDK